MVSREAIDMAFLRYMFVGDSFGAFQRLMRPDLNSWLAYPAMFVPSRVCHRARVRLSRRGFANYDA